MMSGTPDSRTVHAVLLALVLAGCSGSGGDAPATPTPPPTPPPSAGLDRRPANASCTAPARATGADIVATRVFPALTFSAPVGLLQAPGDASRWFVLEQAGLVRAFANDAAAAAAPTVLDLRSRVTSGGETGLLGLAFHPRFPTDPRVFLSYTTGGGALVSRISEFRTGDGGATLDPASERVLLSVSQPEANHNGGNIAFGPDGMLYIGLGDGGGGGDVHGDIGNGQRLSTLLGKMLRIDVDATPASGATYAIPGTNPFATGTLCGNGGTGASGSRCAEIYAYGLRNPWRFSFDRGDGALWAADVGQGAWEEIDRVSSGGNYGWRCREGAHVFNATCGGATNLIEPVAEYARSEGSSVTGGYVYRGALNPLLLGRYVFGDFGSGRIWSIPADTQPTVTVSGGSASGLNISAFGEDVGGELYAVNYGGTLHRLAQASGAAPAGGVATQLSQTGCATAGAPATPTAGMIPYAPNAAFWSDGADKERYLAVPDGTAVARTTDGDFDFPRGSVLVKHFRLGTRLVETRLFMLHPDGVWSGYSYEWNTAGTDATRVIGGKTITVDGRTWTFPSEGECLQCHTPAAGYTLGLEVAQLNGPLRYPVTGRTANQLTTLDAIGLLSVPLGGDPATLPRLPDPYGATGTPAERARAYLHVNCSQCHRPGSGGAGDMDLRYATPLAQMNACGVAPVTGDLGIAGARRLAPGAASQSVLVARMNRRGTGQMPPLASHAIDTPGVAVVAQWIDSLSGCN
jgi:uncharacterized repeat protein (TIGR03806 family)